MPLFADLDRLRADLDALRPLAPEQEARVLQKFRLEWNYNSNAIEGNSLTLGETRSLLLHGLTAAGKPIRDHLDIKGHNEAVVALEEFVRSEYPLTEQFVREMHQLLLGEAYEVPAQTASGQPTRKLIVPGRYKTSPNNVLTATGEMFYFASVEETPGRMTDLVDWYRAEEASPTMHPVALAAEFHYRFVRIHPFDDGNGRMSRLLMNLILLRHGYPMTVIQAADRNRYLAALSEADAGEPEPFLRFIIENVEASLRLMIRAARGESIDELSDLDKKMALLKKQVLYRYDFGKATWSLVTQAKLYENHIRFWLEDLGNELSRFNELFDNTKVFLEARDISKQSITSKNIAKQNNITKSALSAIIGVVNAQQVPPNLSNSLNFANEIFSNSEKLIGEIQFNFVWNRFRVLLIPFDYGAHIRFTFSAHHYKAEISGQIHDKHGYSSSNQEVLDTTYIASLSHTQIHEINHQLANKVYDFIAAKLAEVDTPPA